MRLVLILPPFQKKKTEVEEREGEKNKQPTLQKSVFRLEEAGDSLKA